MENNTKSLGLTFKRPGFKELNVVLIVFVLFLFSLYLLLFTNLGRAARGEDLSVASEIGFNDRDFGQTLFKEYQKLSCGDLFTNLGLLESYFDTSRIASYEEVVNPSTNISFRCIVELTEDESIQVDLNRYPADQDVPTDFDALYEDNKADFDSLYVDEIATDLNGFLFGETKSSNCEGYVVYPIADLKNISIKITGAESCEEYEPEFFSFANESSIKIGEISTDIYDTYFN